jgi:RHH-type proline utilization regulon transcriptional repressor/proline dehydrogenase/delta 1-pyrroline-5-carboxylate dehydrogenase
VALQRQIGAALATGNRVVVPPGALRDVPAALAAWIDDTPGAGFDVVLFDGPASALLALMQDLAARPGPVIPVYAAPPGGVYPWEGLVLERSISTNTTAAGGNASLMMIGS